jgi:hypothetical protein
VQRHRTIFIGHATSDGPLAKRLKDAIVSSVDRRVDVFVSSDLDSIKGGEDWLERILDRLRHCRVVIAIITPHTVSSHWVHYEVGVADAGDPVVIPVTARGARLSEIPAPLGRRQGRNLARPDDLRVLFDEVAAALGVPRSVGPVVGLGEVLREARRPVLAAKLSSAAVRIAEILSARSRNAVAWDPSLDAETLRLELDVDAITFRGAIDELQDLGWLLSREGVEPDRITSVGPAEGFFVEAEAALGSSDPHADARRIAAIVARRAAGASSVAEIARELRWPVRRTNAALHVLAAAAPDALVAAGSPGAFAYLLVLPDAAILRLARSSGVRF